MTIDGGASVNFATLALGPREPGSTPIDGGHGTLVLGGATSSLSLSFPIGGTSFIGAGSTFGGSGRLIVNNGTFQQGGTLFVADNGTIQYNGGTVILTIARLPGGQIRVAPGTDKVLRVGALVVTGPGTVDLSDNYMTLSDSPLSTPIRSLLATGYANGAWTGTGLTSSAAAANTGYGLGYAVASDLPSVPPIFGTIPASTRLVRSTRYGDADLNGIVNLADFDRLAGHFGSTDAFWSDGDFNYDGAVNLQDFNELAGNFGLSATGPAVTPQDWSALAAAVPEPSWLTATLAIALLPRLRRR